MGDIVNLRQARKAKARTTAATHADANRAAFGRTRADRDAAAAERVKIDRVIDGAKRDR